MINNLFPLISCVLLAWPFNISNGAQDNLRLAIPLYYLFVFLDGYIYLQLSHWLAVYYSLVPPVIGCLLSNGGWRNLWLNQN